MPTATSVSFAPNVVPCRNGAPTGDTGAYSPVNTDASNTQQTQPVRTGTVPAEQEWAALMASSDDDAQATAPLPKSAPVSTVTAPAAASSSAHESTPTTSTGAAWPQASSEHEGAPVTSDIAPTSTGVSFGTMPVERSMRGFWFGVVAVLPIVIVLALASCLMVGSATPCRAGSSREQRSGGRSGGCLRCACTALRCIHVFPPPSSEEHDLNEYCCRLPEGRRRSQ